MTNSEVHSPCGADAPLSDENSSDGAKCLEHPSEGEQQGSPPRYESELALYPTSSDLDDESPIFPPSMSEGWPWDRLEAEKKRLYGPGGLCPLALGRRMGPDERYFIVNKLGYGRRSTVWLCHDRQVRKWRALKILRSDISHQDGPELKAIEQLGNTTEDELMENYIGLPIEHFWTDSPSGKHLCLVLPLLGPTIKARYDSYEPFQDRDELEILGKDHPEITKEIGFQITKGLDFLHRRGICHGDLRPTNILLQYEGLDNMSRSDVVRLFGDPRISTVQLRPEDDKKYYPPYIVRIAATEKLSRFLVPKIAIVGFGRSYMATGPPVDRCLLNSFVAPETLFKPSNPAGMPSDIWALACTLCALEIGDSPFSGYRSHLLGGLEIYLGPLPEAYRGTWKENWRDILSIWGRTVREDVVKAVEKYWEQQPEDGQELACLSTSTEELVQMRRAWSEESGYQDGLRNLLGGEITGYLRDQSLTAEGISSGPAWKKNKDGPTMESTLLFLKSCGLWDLDSEPSESGERQGNSGEENTGEDPLEAPLSPASRDSSLLKAQARALQRLEFKRNVYQLSQGIGRYGPKRVEPSLFSTITHYTMEDLHRLGLSDMEINYGRLAPHKEVELEKNDYPRADKVDEDDDAASEESVPTSQDSLLDVCEPTKPHPSEIEEMHRREWPNPEHVPQPPYLKPDETYREWMDEYGKRHKAWRRPREMVVCLTDLLHKMLRYDPKKRIDTVAVMRHEWFGDRGKASNGDASHENSRSMRGEESPGSSIKPESPTVGQISPKSPKRKKEVVDAGTADEGAEPKPKLRRSARIAERDATRRS